MFFADSFPDLFFSCSEAHASVVNDTVTDTYDEDGKPPTPPLLSTATSRPTEAGAGERERGGEGEGEGRDASKKAEAPVSKAVVEEGGGERRRRSDGAAREDGAGGGEAVAAGDIEAQNAAATKIQSRARGMQASMPHTQSPVNTSSFS